MKKSIKMEKIIDSNLVLTGYGVTLRRLTHDKIEMMRQWRNDPKIQQFMIYREYITPEMQEKWFEKNNNNHNFYFIIEYEGREVGVINIKDVDYERKTGEPGIFLYADELWNSDVGMRASLCMSNFTWDTLCLESLYCHVVASNKRALQYNLLCGYEIVPGYENEQNKLLVITREKAKNPSPKLQRIMRVLSK